MIDPPKPRLCKNCVSSECLRLTSKMVCTHPEVNAANIAFLSGENAVAMSTKLARSMRSSPCGPLGRLYKELPAADAAPRLAPVDTLDI